MKGFGPITIVQSCLILVAIIILAGTPSRVQAFPLYAAQEGFTCVTCHFDPNGGGVRKDIGFLFARQRHSLEPELDERGLSLMSLTNNLGDVFYFGGNIRTTYLHSTADEYVGTKPEDVSTFFQMQGALFTALRPHKNLAWYGIRISMSSPEQEPEISMAWSMASRPISISRWASSVFPLGSEIQITPTPRDLDF